MSDSRLNKSDLLHIVAIVLVICASIVANIPYWSGIYAPIYMPYHYYPTCMAVGLYSAHRYHQTLLWVAILAILGASIAFVWGTFWWNEAAQAGQNFLLGERTYSHIAGSNTSLLVTTSKSDTDSPTYSSMNTLDTVVMCFLIVLNPILILNTGLHIQRVHFTCDKKGCQKTPYAPPPTQLEGRIGIFFACALGIGIFFYYLVGGLLMLVNSILLLNPIASPNPMFIFISFASPGIPHIDLIKSNILIRLYGWSLALFWLWSIAISITTISQLAAWRMEQTPYISTTNGICPTAEIVQSLTPTEYEWGNFTLSGFTGVDEISYHNNTIQWSPEGFATYSCADDALMLAQIGVSLLGFIFIVIYLMQRTTMENVAYRTKYQPISQNNPGDEA